MFRSVVRFGLQGAALRQRIVTECRPIPAMGCAARQFSHAVESEADIDARYEAYFSRPDIDGWEVRKGMTDMHGMDMVPNPDIVRAALKACRRVNDYALCIRFLESLKEKTLGEPSLYDYLMKEVQPTMKELGISSLEEMGYDKPELYLESPYDM